MAAPGRPSNLDDPWLMPGEQRRNRRKYLKKKRERGTITDQELSWLARDGSKHYTDDHYPGPGASQQSTVSPRAPESPPSSPPAPGASAVPKQTDPTSAQQAPTGERTADATPPPTSAEAKPAEAKTPGTEPTGAKRTDPQPDAVPPPRQAEWAPGSSAAAGQVDPTAPRQKTAGGMAGPRLDAKGQPIPTWRETVAHQVYLWVERTNKELERGEYYHLPAPAYSQTEWAVADLLWERFPEGHADAAAFRNAMLGVSLGGTAACMAIRWYVDRRNAQQEEEAKAAEKVAAARNAHEGRIGGTPGSTAEPANAGNGTDRTRTSPGADSADDAAATERSQRRASKIITL